MQEAEERRKRLKAIRDTAAGPESYASGRGKMSNPLLDGPTAQSSAPSFSFYSDPLAALKSARPQPPRVRQDVHAQGQNGAASPGHIAAAPALHLPGLGQGCPPNTPHRVGMDRSGVAPHRPSVPPAAKDHSGMRGRLDLLPIIEALPDPHLGPRHPACHISRIHYIRGEDTREVVVAVKLNGVRMAVAEAGAEAGILVGAGVGEAGAGEKAALRRTIPRPWWRILGVPSASPRSGTRALPLTDCHLSLEAVLQQSSVLQPKKQQKRSRWFLQKRWSVASYLRRVLRTGHGIETPDARVF
ncbi:g3887 [Coccomyxa elongata]